MIYFPPEIRTEIFRKLGRHGFRELGPVIASGRDGKDTVFTPEVLSEVEIDEFIFASSLANEGSPYRPFFLKCFNAGNDTAKYVEGVRRLVKHGPSKESLDLIKETEKYIVYAGFAYSIFAICCGRYEEGITAMNELSNKVAWLDDLVAIGDLVMAQIADIEPPPERRYISTYKYPEGDVPNCVHFACTMEDVCFDCIAYFYSRRLWQLC